MPHPEVPPPSCMSCGRDLRATSRFGIVRNPKRGVPDDVDCCSLCWRNVPVHERIKIAIMIHDRQFGGVISVLTELVHTGLLNNLKTTENEP